jgi:hypothetical protein
MGSGERTSITPLSLDNRGGPFYTGKDRGRGRVRRGVPFLERSSLRICAGGSFPDDDGGTLVSIVRVGLAETKRFAEGYEAIFGKKKAESEEKTEEASTRTKTAKKKKKPAKKKK